MKNKYINGTLFLATLIAAAIKIVKFHDVTVLVPAGILIFGLVFEVIIQEDGLNRNLRKTSLIFIRYWLLMYVCIGRIPRILSYGNPFWLLKAIVKSDHFLVLLVGIVLLMILMVLFIDSVNKTPRFLAASGLMLFVTIQMTNRLNMFYGTGNSDAIWFAACLVCLPAIGEAAYIWSGQKSSSELKLFWGGWGSVLIVLSIYSENAVYAIFEILEHYTLIFGVILVFGILMILSENNPEEYNDSSRTYQNEEIGTMMVAWIIHIVLVSWMPQYQGEFCLFAIPAAYLLRVYVLKFCIEENYQVKLFGRELGNYEFLLYFWFLGIVGAMAITRELEHNKRYIFLILALLVVRSICMKWTKEQTRKKIMFRFWGIAWLLLAAGVSFDFTQISQSLTILAALAVVAVLWYVHCDVVEKLNQSESRMFMDEYKKVTSVHKAVPTVLAVITVTLMMVR